MYQKAHALYRIALFPVGKFTLSLSPMDRKQCCTTMACLYNCNECKQVLQGPGGCSAVRLLSCNQCNERTSRSATFCIGPQTLDHVGNCNSALNENLRPKGAGVRRICKRSARPVSGSAKINLARTVIALVQSVRALQFRCHLFERVVLLAKSLLGDCWLRPHCM